MRTDDEEFDKFINKLQEEIYQEELQSFSKTVVEEFHHPKNWGEMKDPGAEARIKGPCGDTQIIYLKIENNTIKKATFITDGCGPTIACGSKLTTMVTNKTIDEAKNISPKDLDDALDGLPDDHKHCSLLAVNTLRKAINDIKKEKK